MARARVALAFSVTCDLDDQVSGPSLWVLMNLALRPALYSLIFFAGLIAVLAIASCAPRTAYASSTMSAGRLVRSLAMTQVLAITVAALMVCAWLGWTSHPSPHVIERWADNVWHFFLPDALSKVGVAATVFMLCHNSKTARHSIGIRRPEMAIWKCGVLMALCFVALHWLVAPASLGGWRWLTGFFGGATGPDGAAIDQIKLEAWSLQEIIRQEGFLGEAFVLVWLGLLVPVIEELFYRGVVLSTLSTYVPTWPALMIQALLFSASHLDMDRLPYLFFLGLILGWLTKRTSSVFPAAILHIAVNLASLLLLAT